MVWDHVTAVASGFSVRSTVPRAGLANVRGIRWVHFMITASTASVALNDQYFAQAVIPIRFAASAAAFTTLGGSMFIIALHACRHASFTCTMISAVPVWSHVVLLDVCVAPRPASAAAVRVLSACDVGTAAAVGRLGPCYTSFILVCRGIEPAG